MYMNTHILHIYILFKMLFVFTLTHSFLVALAPIRSTFGMNIKKWLFMVEGVSCISGSRKKTMKSHLSHTPYLKSELPLMEYFNIVVLILLLLLRNFRLPPNISVNAGMSKPAKNRWVTPFPMQRAEFAFLCPNDCPQECA